MNNIYLTNNLKGGICLEYNRNDITDKPWKTRTCYLCTELQDQNDVSPSRLFQLA
jgi:hypothetical protein